MKKILYYLSFCHLLTLVMSCNVSNATSGTNEQSNAVVKDSIDFKVDQLMAKMTLEEKIGQMNQYNGFWDVTGPAPANGAAANKYEHLKKGWVGSMLNVSGVKNVREVQKIAVEETRLGIPLIIGFDVIHGYKTVSPIPLAEAASWDLEAIKLSAQVAAEEAAASGINWTFAPMVDISRDARWGRVMEGAGEDPYLGSMIAKARVEGFQGDDLSLAHTIVACAKHFAGYGFAEAGRDYNTVDVGTSTLYNIILPPFKAAVDAGVRTFMNGFNELNGVPVTGSAFLQRDILKNEWNFDGFVVTDWGSINEMIAHRRAKNRLHAAEIAIKAGADMDMESYAYVNELAQLVNEGKVDIGLIDDAVKRILRVKYELGLFEDPYKYCNETTETEVIGSKRINDIVLDVAKKSIVLLKNENQILPLKKQGQKIALIGALANDKTSPLGSWRIGADDGTAVSVLEGMKAYKGNTLKYEKGADVATGEIAFPKELTINVTDKSGFASAIAAAKNADVVVMVLGEHGLQSGEGRSRSELGLPGVQQELLEAIYKANKNIVLVLNNGRPLTINWADANIPAIVEAWHLGTQSGHAIAQVLYGDYNPSGKLPMSFPKNVGQVPMYYNYKSTGRPTIPAPGEVFWSHYSDVSNAPLYPFGFGLSYTTFAYSNLKVERVSDDVVEVSVNLTNTGNVKGKEVAQLYLRDEFASVTRPVRELKGFELVSLNPKESKTLKFVLTKSELGFYDNDGKYIVEPGTFSVFVGGSSEATLSAQFEL
ncbi:beta-glucosidase [Gelidibacter sediminis]|uniref:beta-glucosidase n=1 Tax=Gelidibacter sediminis TaxID=1608710 RepID=A0A4R7PZ48_9FLAO|nr:beta-glucosidase BglX [Gelidibacter sediminis]TDU40305.1 beta-glucosidase [Gelidibacter sediminis]